MTIAVEIKYSHYAEEDGGQYYSFNIEEDAIDLLQTHLTISEIDKLLSALLAFRVGYEKGEVEGSPGYQESDIPF